MDIRIAICEKDVKQREYVTANIKELQYDIVCEEFGNVYDLQEKFEENEGVFDVVLISTTLQHRGDGMELAHSIREISLKPAIIMMAESGDYMRDAFDIFAMAYLMKPISFRDLERAFTFYTKNSKSERRASWMVKSKGGNWTRLFCRDIEYIESSNREILVHMSNGTTVSSYAKLSEVEEQLNEESFVRCHQSYIVNMFYVNELNSSEFMMRDVALPISRKFNKVVKETYYQYMFSRM